MPSDDERDDAPSFLKSGDEGGSDDEGNEGEASDREKAEKGETEAEADASGGGDGDDADAKAGSGEEEKDDDGDSAMKKEKTEEEALNDGDKEEERAAEKPDDERSADKSDDEKKEGDVDEDRKGEPDTATGDNDGNDDEDGDIEAMTVDTFRYPSKKGADFNRVKDAPIPVAVKEPYKKNVKKFWEAVGRENFIYAVESDSDPPLIEMFVWARDVRRFVLVKKGLKLPDSLDKTARKKVKNRMDYKGFNLPIVSDRDYANLPARGAGRKEKHKGDRDEDEGDDEDEKKGDDDGARSTKHASSKLYPDKEAWNRDNPYSVLIQSADGQKGRGQQSTKRSSERSEGPTKRSVERSEGPSSSSSSSSSSAPPTSDKASSVAAGPEIWTQNKLGSALLKGRKKALRLARDYLHDLLNNPTFKDQPIKASNLFRAPHSVLAQMEEGAHFRAMFNPFKTKAVMQAVKDGHIDEAGQKAISTAVNNSFSIVLYLMTANDGVMQQYAMSRLPPDEIRENLRERKPIARKEILRAMVDDAAEQVNRIVSSVSKTENEEVIDQVMKTYKLDRIHAIRYLQQGEGKERVVDLLDGASGSDDDDFVADSEDEAFVASAEEEEESESGSEEESSDEEESDESTKKKAKKKALSKRKLGQKKAKLDAEREELSHLLHSLSGDSKMIAKKKGDDETKAKLARRITAIDDELEAIVDAKKAKEEEARQAKKSSKAKRKSPSVDREETKHGCGEVHPSPQKTRRLDEFFAKKAGGGEQSRKSGSTKAADTVTLDSLAAHDEYIKAVVEIGMEAAAAKKASGVKAEAVKKEPATRVKTEDAKAALKKSSVKARAASPGVQRVKAEPESKPRVKLEQSIAPAAAGDEEERCPSCGSMQVLVATCLTCSGRRCQSCISGSVCNDCSQGLT